MPALPTWFSRLDEIIELLSALSIPVVDRSLIERIFHLRKRRAITLMHHFGGYSAGNSALLDRLDLNQRLRDLALSPTVLHETIRKEKLAAHLVELERSRAGAHIIIGVRNPAERWLTALPPAIHISAGQLVVEYSSPEALFKTLYDFGQTAANNYEWVCHAFKIAESSDGMEPIVLFYQPFTALLHHVTINLLRDGYYALKREAAPGVDGVSWPEYETDLDEKLADLHRRIHGGTDRA